MIEDIWYLKGINIFEEITEREARLLKHRSEIKEYARYSLICDNLSDNSLVYVIKEGSVKIYKPDSEEDDDESKKPVQMNLLQKGASPQNAEFMNQQNDIFSQLMDDTVERDEDKELKQLPVTLESGELFGIMRHSDQIGYFVAESMDDSEIYITRYSTLKLLFKYNPERSVKVRKFEGWRKYKLQNRIRSLVEQDVVSRVSSLLLDFSERYSTWKSSKAVLDFKLSTEKLSKLVGATKKDVEQVLELLKREDIISIKRKKISILNRWELKKTARRGRLNIKGDSEKGY